MLSRRKFSINLSKMFAGLPSLFNLPVYSISQFSFSHEDLTDLKEKVDGNVTTRGEKGYEVLRRNMSWQFRKTSRKPEILVQANNKEDLIEAVKFASRNQLKIGIRTGGHSWVHSSVREGGMLVDLGYLKRLEIDKENKTAIVGPAWKARELMAALKKEDLAFPVAHCGTVALGGYLLGGGQSWNNGSWGGAACHSIKALDVITAKGELIRVDENNHSDLFWAAKGAGPGFPGIVTAYHLQLYTLPTAIHMNTYIWSLTETLSVSDWLTKVSEGLSNKVEVLMFLSTLPESINEVNKVVIVSAVAFADSNEEATTLMAPLSTIQNLASPLLRDDLKQVEFSDLFNLVDQSFFPCRTAADTFWFDISMREVMERYVDHFSSAPSPFSNVLCEVKANPDTGGDAAYSMQSATYLSPYAFWLHEKDDEQNLQWMRTTQEILAPLSAGHYVNEADLEASPSRSERSFTQENWQRIKKVRAKYDPKSLFHSYPGT